MRHAFSLDRFRRSITNKTGRHAITVVFDIQNSALSFFRFYFTERKQIVSISGYSSDPFNPLHGVAQGAVLGLILFLLYTQPLSQVLDIHSVSHYLTVCLLTYSHV